MFPIQFTRNFVMKDLETTNVLNVANFSRQKGTWSDTKPVTLKLVLLAVISVPRSLRLLDVCRNIKYCTWKNLLSKLTNWIIIFFNYVPRHYFFQPAYLTEAFPTHSRIWNGKKKELNLKFRRHILCLFHSGLFSEVGLYWKEYDCYCLNCPFNSKSSQLSYCNF